MRFETAQNVISALAENEVSEVAFLGGDPCEYPRLVELAGYAKSLDLKTTVVSNTHDYGDLRASDVASVIDCLETTFHGPSPAAHNSIALRDGAYERVIANLMVLAGHARSLGIIYNILPMNCRDLWATVDGLISGYGLRFDHLIVQRIVPQGRARRENRFTIGLTHALAALDDVQKVDRDFGLSILFEDPLPWCVIPKRFHRYMGRCEWGFTRAAVDAEGDLSRCGADPRYRLGNILEVPLLELWNTSDVLRSFRSREYLPEACRECELLEKCGGGCALSCELETDHGLDYLFFEGRRGVVVGDAQELRLRAASREDLSDILRMEWASFPDYPFKLTGDSISAWFRHNADMFFVLGTGSDRPIGYACVVPLTDSGYAKIRGGAASSLVELEPADVVGRGDLGPGIWHVEVIATSAAPRSRAGRLLIRSVGEILIGRARRLTASPITPTGFKLCDYFGFKPVAAERGSSGTFVIYEREVDQEEMRRRLRRF